MRISRVIILIALPGIIFAQSSRVFTENELESCIVFLSQSRVGTTRIDGEELEVWFRKPGTDTLIPKTETATGTGFLVVDKGALFLVTAAHVAEKMERSALMILRGDNDVPIRINIVELNPDPKWRIHDSADVALLGLHPNVDTVRHLLQGHFLPSELLDDKLEAPKSDILLTVIGFPLSLGVNGHFSPLLMRTRVASGLLNLPRADNHKLSTFFIGENPSVGGYSGSPCIDVSIVKQLNMMSVGEGTKVYGIMHGTLSDETGGKLSAITPTKYIWDLLNPHH